MEQLQSMNATFDYHIQNEPSIHFIGVNVAPIQHRSYGDLKDLLVWGDISCQTVHYFKHRHVPA
jgi:hypothetical protein